VVFAHARNVSCGRHLLPGGEGGDAQRNIPRY
jgi:hypothetical protein